MQIVFLLGAGFNADARAEVGFVESTQLEGKLTEAAYPLTADLAKYCFDINCPPAGRSVEDLFQEAHNAGNSKPLRHLANRLMYADYELAQKLIPYFGAQKNCYSMFFERFTNATFLTFNYDSLPELFLLRQRKWFPYDGYGVPVDTNNSFNYKRPRDQRSTSLVLHLHGSLCLYNSTYTIRKSFDGAIPLLKQRDEPKFLFDPDKIGSLFSPFEKVT